MRIIRRPAKFGRARLLLVIGLIILAGCTQKPPPPVEEAAPLSVHSVSYMTIEVNGHKFQLLVPDYPDDPALSQKIYDNLRDAHMWFPDHFAETIRYGFSAPYISDRYFCTHVSFSDQSEFRSWSHTIITTIDMQTGELIYLDDLIEVNEAFLDLFLTSGTIRLEEQYGYDVKDVGDTFSQERLDTWDPDHMFARLKFCSEPFDADNYGKKPTIFLAPGRLYFVNLSFGWPHTVIYYVSVDDLEPFLKVDKW